MSIDPTPDRAEVRRFLELLRTKPPWDLVLIHPETGKVEGRSPTDLDAATDIAVAGNAAGWNVYFSVARLSCSLGGWKRKANKKEVASLALLWVDIDRPDGATRLKAGAFPPTGVVFTGGGFQSFWRLRSPFKINGDQDRWEEFERYGYALEKALDGDNCRNVERIMRVAGSINWPDQRKRERGREPAMARVLEWDNSIRYDLAQFPHAEPPVQVGKVTVNLPALEFPADLPALDDVDIEMVETRTRDLHPEVMYPRDSRNERQMSVLCGLVDVGLGDEWILACLLDERTWIGRATLFESKGGRRPDPRAYAEKQVQKAHAFVEARRKAGL